jgi:hypothetical protein
LMGDYRKKWTCMSRRKPPSQPKADSLKAKASWFRT